MKIISSFLILGLLLISNGIHASIIEFIKKDPVAYDASVPKPTMSNVSYGEHSRHVLDFWKAESEQPTPLVFVIHGGGWNGNSKEIVDRFVEVQQLLDAGISVVTINYRLMKHARKQEIVPLVKAPLYDAARALQFVRSKAGEWNIDKERIGAAGGSAGACSSLWLTYHNDLADANSIDLVAQESTRLWCAAVNRPQTTLDPKLIKEWIPNCEYGEHAFGKASFKEYLADRESILPLINEYSPYSHVSADDPSVYLFYKNPPAMGEHREDPVHSSNFGVKLQEKCTEVGIDCELQYPDAPDVKHATTTDYLIEKLKENKEIKVSSLSELREEVLKSNQHITMKPGNYIITELPEESRSIICSGSNNLIDLTEVYINFPVGTCKDAHFNFTGNHNKLLGGVFEDTYQNGMTKVTDFGSYNQNRTTLAKGLKGGATIRVSGDENTIEGIKLTVRGSFPYGYGNMYGIGRGNATGLDKRCALLITGIGNTVDNCEFQHRAFGHVIYMQNNADKTVIKNTYIEGAVRPSNDIYKETNDGDLPKKFGYKMPIGQMKGLPIPRDVMFNLTEDGIRAYKIPGSVTVENCVVKKCRGGIKLYMAKGKVKVSNSTVEDCIVEGYTLNNGGEMINCKGNAAYGPLVYMHSNNSSNQKIELTVLPAPHAVGNHVFAAIKGKNHDITLKYNSSSEKLDNTLRPIVIGYPARFEFLTTDFPGVPKGYEENFKTYYGSAKYEASNINITNHTEYLVKTGAMSKNNTIKSVGIITDLGENNKISKIDK